MESIISRNNPQEISISANVVKKDVIQITEGTEKEKRHNFKYDQCSTSFFD